MLKRNLEIIKGQALANFTLFLEDLYRTVYQKMEAYKAAFEEQVTSEINIICFQITLLHSPPEKRKLKERIDRLQESITFMMQEMKIYKHHMANYRFRDRLFVAKELMVPDETIELDLDQSDESEESYNNGEAL
jgi:hypothetical protein